MGRLADILHIGFAVQPDWNPNEPLHASNIHVETFASRQVEQLTGWGTIVLKLQKIIQEELGVAHIMQFQTKLHQVSPGPGYRVDPETQQTISHGVQLAPREPTLAAAPSVSTITHVMPTICTIANSRIAAHASDNTMLATPTVAGVSTTSPECVDAGLLTANLVVPNTAPNNVSIRHSHYSRKLAPSPTPASPTVTQELRDHNTLVPMKGVARERLHFPPCTHPFPPVRAHNLPVPSSAGGKIAGPSVGGTSASVAGMRASVAGTSVNIVNASTSIAGASTSVVGASTSVADASASVVGTRASVADTGASVVVANVSLAGVNSTPSNHGGQTSTQICPGRVGIRRLPPATVTALPTRGQFSHMLGCLSMVLTGLS